MQNTAEPVTWTTVEDDTVNVKGVRIGSVAQNVLGFKGDGVTIDWGYLYLGTVSTSSSRNANAIQYYGGALLWARGNFSTSGNMAIDSGDNPRNANDNLPGIAVIADLGVVPRDGKAISQLLLMAYDDIYSTQYYGERVKAIWTLTYDRITEAMAATWQEFPDILKVVQNMLHSQL